MTKLFEQIKKEPESGAIFGGTPHASQYRYALWRVWHNIDKLDAARFCNMVLLNPSKAGATVNDPTITLQIQRAKRHGFDGLIVTNVLAWCDTDPQNLYAEELLDPVGPNNDFWLEQAAASSVVVIFGWGIHLERVRPGRSLAIYERLLQVNTNIKCLGVTASGAPNHPLYVKQDAKLKTYKPEMRPWDR